MPGRSKHSKQNPLARFFTQSHAFLIGINEYDHLMPLRNAVNDANGIASRSSGGSS